MEYYIDIKCQCGYNGRISFENIINNGLICHKCSKSTELIIKTMNGIKISYLISTFMSQMTMKYFQKFKDHDDSWITDYDPKHKEIMLKFLKEKCIDHIQNNHFVGASLYCLFLNYLIEIKTPEDKEKFMKIIK